MSLLFFYSLRNLLTRRLTTILTALGMALVVFVFASIIMLAEGLQKTLVETGSSNNVVILRRSAETEVQSRIDRHQASVLETLSEIALNEDGQRMIAKELLVLITMQKKYSEGIANVIIRGISKQSFALRPQVKLMIGRMPRWGTSEIVVGQSVAKRFKNSGLQETLYFAMRPWNIVGVFDAGETGFSSEIWGDADQLMQSFRRHTYSSVIFRLRYTNLFEGLKKDISKDPRLTLSTIREKDYYLKQSETMATFLRILGISLTLIFSLGAMVGAMITMYAAVANRTAEIGTLRALGFQRKSILFTFLLESLILGFFGGCAGLVFASFLQLITISTMNFQTFSELAFSFTITSGIIIKSMLFSIFMGFVGGVLPAFKASRMNIVDSLREV